VLFVDSLCHGCGGCVLACPRGAIREGSRDVGFLRSGTASDLRFVQGALSVGEARSVPVVDAVLERVRQSSLAGCDVIVDGPPGAACPVAQVVRSADVCLLVTEPTPFGLHDLVQAHELVAARRKPAGVILNRATGAEADCEIEAWCAKRGLPLLVSIPDRRSIAEAYARGVPLYQSYPEAERLLAGLRAPLRRLAEKGWSGAAA
jgi:MinD superfamily P-loop ATPase